MTIPTEVIMRMATLGLNEEQAKAIADMLTAVEAATAETIASGFEEKIESSREKGRQRWRTWDEKRRTNVSQRLPTTANVSQQLTGGDAPVEDKTSNSEIEPQEENKKRAKALSPEFDEFWTEYPNKVGKPKALASFNAARGRATHAEIMDGLRRYVLSKPADRAWLNPATFLNQDRFNDQPAAITPMARGSPAYQAPSMSEMLRAVKEYPYENQPEPPEDRSGFRAAVSHLRAVGTG